MYTTCMDLIKQHVKGFKQGWAILFLEGCSPARFPSIPDVLSVDYLDHVFSQSEGETNLIQVISSGLPWTRIAHPWSTETA